MASSSQQKTTWYLKLNRTCIQCSSNAKETMTNCRWSLCFLKMSLTLRALIKVIRTLLVSNGLWMLIWLDKLWQSGYNLQVLKCPKRSDPKIHLSSRTTRRPILLHKLWLTTLFTSKTICQQAMIKIASRLCSSMASRILRCTWWTKCGSHLAEPPKASNRKRSRCCLSR